MALESRIGADRKRPRFRRPGDALTQWRRPLEPLRDEPPLIRRLLIPLRLLALRELGLLARDVLVGDEAEQARNAVQARAALVVRFDHVPGRLVGVGRVEHA